MEAPTRTDRVPHLSKRRVPPLYEEALLSPVSHSKTLYSRLQGERCTISAYQASCLFLYDRYRQTDVEGSVKTSVVQVGNDPTFNDFQSFT